MAARAHACACVCLQGKDAVPFLEGLVVGDVAGLADGTGTLSVFTNEQGGVIDDTGVGWGGGTRIRVWRGGTTAMYHCCFLPGPVYSAPSWLLPA